VFAVFVAWTYSLPLTLSVLWCDARRGGVPAGRCVVVAVQMVFVMVWHSCHDRRRARDARRARWGCGVLLWVAFEPFGGVQVRFKDVGTHKRSHVRNGEPLQTSVTRPENRMSCPERVKYFFFLEGGSSWVFEPWL